MIRIAIVIVFAGCAVKDLDLTGKECPCPASWVCSDATHTCGRADSIVDASPDVPDGPPPEVPDQPDVSCLPGSPRSDLVYHTVRFPDFPIPWTTIGGIWSRVGNSVIQTDSSAALAYAYRSVPTSQGAPNYRIVATIQPSAGNPGSVGIATRIDPIAGSMYECTFEPNTGKLSLQIAQNGVRTVLSMTTYAVADPSAAVTMELGASSSDHICCVRDHSGPALYALDATLPVGDPGLETSGMAATFTRFTAFE